MDSKLQVTEFTIITLFKKLHDFRKPTPEPPCSTNLTYA